MILYPVNRIEQLSDPSVQLSGFTTKQSKTATYIKLPCKNILSKNQLQIIIQPKNVPAKSEWLFIFEFHSMGTLYNRSFQYRATMKEEIKDGNR
jgi:hypothetical protein